jgi:hypothetical protein
MRRGEPPQVFVSSKVSPVAEGFEEKPAAEELHIGNVIDREDTEKALVPGRVGGD